MKIKVSFRKVVDADSIDDAYAKTMDDLAVLVGDNLGLTVEKYFDSSEVPPWENAAFPQPTYEKTTYMRCDTEITEMNGFTFEDLGEHSGYGEGSIKDWTDDQ